MSRGDRSSERAAPITVPPADAAWPDIWRFALTYNAYDRLGGFEQAAAVGNRYADRWRTQRELPAGIDTARVALFFEQRRYRHFDSDPSGKSETYIRALVGRIDELSCGTIAGPPDPLP